MGQDAEIETKSAVCSIVIEYPARAAQLTALGNPIGKKPFRIDRADVAVFEEEKVLEIVDLKSAKSAPSRFVLSEFRLFNGHIRFGKIGLRFLESRSNPVDVCVYISSDDPGIIEDINDGILASQGRKNRSKATPIASPNKWSPELKKVRPRQTPIPSPITEGNVPVRRFGFGQSISPPRPVSLRMVRSPQVKVADSTSRSANNALDFVASSDLSAEQIRVIETVLKGDSVFFTGGAGTGKSYLLRTLVSLLPNASTAVTASTGIAACNVGGTTLHQFLGIGRVDPAVPGLSQQIAARLRKNPDKIDWIRKTKVLIIDEISLIDASMFELTNDVLNLIVTTKKTTTSPVFFGGIQLVLCGDFLQLPPVGDQKAIKFSFESKIWKKSIKKSFNLTQIFRQSNDSLFANILNEIRIGNCSNETAQTLLDRLVRESSSSQHVIKLLPLNKEVAALNDKELATLTPQVEKQSFHAIDTVFDPNFSMDLVCPAKASMVLPVGARVILVTTLSISDKLVNGATGTIVRFSKSPTIPYVKFDSIPEVVGVPPHEWVFKQGSKELARRRQIPLNLAWGISIHKSQGMTLEKCEVSLDKIFEAGQAYVALSRCKSLDGLRLISDVPSKVSVKSIQRSVRANPICVEFYNRLKNTS